MTTTLTDKIIETGFVDHVLTDIDLEEIVDGSSAARYGMVNKSLKKGELIRIRRGLYVMSEKYRRKKLSKFYFSSRIVPHSYVSLESAMSYHGWIPEGVVTVTSIYAGSRTKKFATPFGEFVFYPLPVNEYTFLTGVARVEEIKAEPFLVASPLRALADFVCIGKINWQGLDYLVSGLRIEKENLLNIKSEDFLEMREVYRSGRVTNFLNNLERELLQ